jgi:hypothetical protein
MHVQATKYDLYNFKDSTHKFSTHFFYLKLALHNLKMNNKFMLIV